MLPAPDTGTEQGEQQNSIEPGVFLTASGELEWNSPCPVPCLRGTAAGRCIADETPQNQERLRLPLDVAQVTLSRPYLESYVDELAASSKPSATGNCRRRHCTLVGSMLSGPVLAAQLWAGVGKADITNEQAGLINDRLYVKALVMKDDATTAAIITVDAVSLGEIGHIGNDYLGKVRAQIEKECQIPPEHVLINASHCHGVVCAEVDQRTVQAVKDACQNMVPVDVGCGVGREDRIMENRRLKLKNGQEADVRHAYSLPPDEEVAEVGPVDPEIGLLRFDRKDGRTLAVIYNFACHPIQGVPNGGITADLTGFASKVIEDNLSDGTMALFLQGCAGDINPVWYKDVDQPRNAEPLGNLLGLSALQGLRKVQCRADNRFTVRRETLELPRADFAERILSMESEQTRLLQSLQGTSLNLKTFIPLVVKYNVSQ